VGGSKKQTDLQLSAGYQVTPQGEARILYNRSRLVSAKTEVWGLGYFHFLSKRTALYTALSRTSTDRQPTVNAYQAGIRHDF
jgi:predicted porin